MNRVRLFISSPADVGDECRRALAVVERLQQEFSDVLQLDAVASHPGDGCLEAANATAAFQASDYDVFTAIFGQQLNGANGAGAADTSSAESLFEAAVAGFRSHGKPGLLVYRRSVPEAVASSPDYAPMNRFFDTWFLHAEDRTAIGAYHTYAEAEQFEDLFGVHLRKLLRRFRPRPNNLPTPASSFVGRTDLIRQATEQLRQSDTRLVSLVGPGGTGKSRLALEVGGALLPDFEDGVFLVTLPSLRQADLLPATIAATLDIKQIDNRPVIDMVVEALQKKDLLLLIDNLEQVQSSLADLSTLVTRCPRLKIVVTSREAVRVSGARTLNVPPFSLPDPKKASFEAIRASESVQLFVERARAADSGFELTEANARDVLQICHRLDGLPLAIELATSRLRSMAVSELLDSMSQRLTVHQDGDDALLDHQRSLRELIAWSYDLLGEEEQALWRRMSVFAGAFTMEAVEDVCDPDDDLVVDIEIEGLVDKSLAGLAFHPLRYGDEEARVSMLDTLREYAREKLAEAGEAAHYSERFRDWVVALAQSSHDQLRSAASDARIERLELEQVNLQGAIDHCLSRQPQDWNRALKIGGGVWFYWFERGMLTGARALFEHALDANPDVEDSVRALALRALGSVARFQNEIDTAERACLQGLDIYRQLGDRAGQGNVLGELGAIAQRKGDMGKAAEYLDQALAMFEAVPEDLHGRSFASAARGVINHLDGDIAGARRFYEEALATGSQSGDTDSIASALVNLGEVAEAEDNYRQAYEHYTRCLELYANRGKKVAIAYCAEVIAGLSIRHLHKPSDAALLLGFADALREETESPIEPFNADRLQSDIAATRDAMFPEAFRASWDAGASLDIDELLAVIRDLELSDEYKNTA